MPPRVGAASLHSTRVHLLDQQDDGSVHIHIEGPLAPPNVSLGRPAYLGDTSRPVRCLRDLCVHFRALGTSNVSNLCLPAALKTTRESLPGVHDSARAPGMAYLSVRRHAQEMLVGEAGAVDHRNPLAGAGVPYSNAPAALAQNKAGAVGGEHRAVDRPEFLGVVENQKRSGFACVVVPHGGQRRASGPKRCTGEQQQAVVESEVEHGGFLVERTGSNSDGRHED